MIEIVVRGLVILMLVSSSLFGQGGSFKPKVDENQHLLIFFYRAQDLQTQEMRSRFKEAIRLAGDGAGALEVQLDDPQHKERVAKYDLKRAPMPFVLVLASNGAVVGAFPASFTSQQLIDSLSSPALASALKALQEHELVLLCLQNSETLENKEALSGVEEFRRDLRFNSGSQAIVVDPKCEIEQRFFAQLGIDTSSFLAMTVLIAPPGDIVGTLIGATSKDQIISLLQGASSPCCGPGCCGPGCCPQRK